MWRQVLNYFYVFFLKCRQHEIDYAANHPHAFQDKILKRLIAKHRKTKFGTIYYFDKISTYDDYAKLVPLQDYESLKPYFSAVLEGEQGVVCADKIRLFAKSSGTTDKSKLIPLSYRTLYRNHFKGGKDMLTLYFKNNPTSKLFCGNNLTISGTFESAHYPRIGDISAHVVANLPSWVKHFRCPESKIAEMSQWEDKLKGIVQQVLHEPISCMSGVPSWMTLVLQRVKEAKTEHKPVWDKVEVFFHGGVHFRPLKEKFEQLIGRKIHYMELYNASEGFFGIQDDLNRSDMMLLCNHEVYYEFMPLNAENQIINLTKVEIGRKYALVITTASGLWRYQLGDVIEFTDLKPHRFIICGRTKQCINIFGEELMVHNADKGIEMVCKKMDLIVTNYTVSPKLLENQRAVHQWLIEFEQDPKDVHEFAKRLDEALCQINSDYEAKRQGDLLLAQLQVEIAPKGCFYNWLKQKNRLGGQFKVPKMTADMDLQTEIKNAKIN